MAYVVMADEVVAYVVVAYAVMTYAVMVCIVMAYAVMAYVVMACIVMAYVVMACVVARSCGALTSISCPSRPQIRIASASSWTGAPASFFLPTRGFCGASVSAGSRRFVFFPRLRGFATF